MRNAIGIDIGGTSIRAARVNEAGDSLAHRVASTAPTAAGVIAQIDAFVAALRDDTCAAIGVGVPSRVNVGSGEIYEGGYVNLAGGPLSARLANAALPVFADNDASMALVAEARLGAGRGLANCVLLTIGTGIGGAVWQEGRILRGARTAGQLGHIAVDSEGAPCACGRAGCLETKSSGTALGRLIAAAGLPATVRLAQLLAASDARSQSVVARWAAPLRAGIDSLVAILDPDIVILGGGLGAEACVALARFPAVSAWFQCPVVPALLGERAGVIGAALAALERAA